MSNDIPQLSIGELLGSDAKYTIPMYQRNYAWGEGEVTQLIRDIIDYLPKENEKPHSYYIGTLVVFLRPNGEFEIIDGQQRLTTLSLLAAYIKNKNSKEPQKEAISNWPENLNLHFESRPNSQKTLNAVFNNQVDRLHLEKHDETNTSILNGYYLVEKILSLELSENKKTTHEFANFLSRILIASATPRYYAANFMAS